MKKLLSVIVLMVLCFTVLPAANTTSSSKGNMVDQTGSWWRALTGHERFQVITVDYAAGDGTSITLTAGCRITGAAGIISTTTYLVPLISATGATSSDPVTILAANAGSYVFVVAVPTVADYVYVKVEYTGGTTATVNINQTADIL